MATVTATVTESLVKIKIMNAPGINEMIVSVNANLKEALVKIDLNAQGLCFVVDETNKLCGVISDGDIRRALIKGKDIFVLVGEVMETSFTYLSIHSTAQQIQEKLNSKIKYIPLVNEQHVPVDYASFSRLHRTPIMQPLLDGNELSYLTECIKTGWISSQGPFVKRFEKEFADFCCAEYPVAVSNGTVALHLALAALGIGPGDEVLIPDLTFAASINAIIYTGATPVIVDVDKVTWTISIEEIKKNLTSKTKAIMPVHLYGHPCHMDEIMEIAIENNLFVIEDAAEAIGTFYKNKHVGTFGHAATFSFFGNKTITTGEGGMVFFKNKKDYEKAIILRDHGMSKEKKYWHDYVGFNYRMTNLQAALGCAQMERISDFIQSKKKLANTYNEFLKTLNVFELPPEESWASCGFWLYTALLSEDAGISRNELIEKLLRNGVETRPVFYPLHEMPPYKGYPTKSDFHNSNRISKQGISLPSSVNITEQEIENISRALNAIFSSQLIQ